MYVALVFFLRISGSRTLSSMNAFDFIVTVAIGSVFGRALTAKDVALSEAIVAFGLLVTLQYVVTWIQLRWPFFRRVVTNPPALLYFRGEFVDSAMRKQRVTESEIKSAVRKKQFGSIDEVEAVVLESSGEFSVIGLRRRRAHVRRATGGPALGVNGSQLTYLACRMLTVCQLRPVPEQHRRTRRLETGWRFHRGDVDGGADPSLDDGSRPMGGGSPTSRGRFGQSRRRTATSSPNTNSTRCSAGPESSALSKKLQTSGKTSVCSTCPTSLPFWRVEPTSNFPVSVVHCFWDLCPPIAHWPHSVSLSDARRPILP